MEIARKKAGMGRSSQNLCTGHSADVQKSKRSFGACAVTFKTQRR
jgi:hypothetical protein